MKLPRYANSLVKPARYKVLHGGRGGAKSETVARLLLLKGLQSPRRVLCAREFQNSIRESVHKLLCNIIEKTPGYREHYHITDQQITCANGTEFIFKGIKQNVDSIKSMTGITDLWIEEGHTITQRSLDVIIPTIRAPGSEIWVTYNPTNEDDPVHEIFVVNEPPPGSVVMNVSWRDNPWFSDELRAEKDHLFKVNPEKALHVWEGGCLTVSDAQIFKDKFNCRRMEVDHRLHEWHGPYFGADWGSVDPTTLVKMWVNKKPSQSGQGTLYIEKEAYKTRVKLNHIPNLFDTVPDSRRHIILADNARPETIEHVKDLGFKIKAAPKWPNSVEEGVEYLKGFDEIVISPDCPETLMEAKKYSYKEDRITGKVTPVIVDDWNHCWDAVRYGLSPFIQKSKNRVGSFTQNMEASRMSRVRRINKRSEAW